MARRIVGKRCRVLYLHGFEENGNSPKPQAIIRDSRFEVCVPPLDMYFTRSNSPIKYALSQPPLLCSIFLGAVGAYGVSWNFDINLFSSLLVMTVITGASAYHLRHKIVAGALDGSYKATYRIAEKSIREFQPDVVVGFSWGGALLCEAIRNHEWRGPTVLLAPAHHKLQELRMVPLTHVVLPDPTTIIHSTGDTLVPIIVSRDLAKGQTGTTLIEVDKDPHAMWSIASDGLLVDVIQRMVPKSS